MRSVTVAELVPDAPLPRGLYSRFGSMLLPPGATLTTPILTRLRAGKHESVLIPDDSTPVPAPVLPIITLAPAVIAPAPAPAPTPPLPTPPLPIPVVIAPPAPATTPEPSLALESALAPEPLPEPVPVHPPEPALPRDETRRRQAAATLRRRGAELLASWSPALDRLPRRFAAASAPAPTVRPARTSSHWLDADIAAMRAERTGVLERIYSRLALGRSLHAGALVDLADELADLALRRSDRFGALAALSPSRGGGAGRPDNLADHTYSVAVLATGIATHRRWSGTDVRTVALAALLADAGMMLLAPDLRAVDSPLSDEQRSRLRDHPTHTLALIDLIETLPPAVAAIVLAHHEREDATGYPRGLRSAVIHDGAKALAVADTLAALTAPRAHRRRVDPFDAMLTVINLGATGSLDRASVGALLRCTGLFPIGSSVLLSTGHSAVSVALPDPARPDRPLVRLIDGPDTGAILDLAAPAARSLRVARAGAAAALITRA